MLFIRRKKSYNKSDVIVYSLLTIVFITGVIYGVCYVKGQQVKITPQGEQLTLLTLVLKSLINNSRTFAWICVFSFSAAGVPVIIYLIYMKGYSYGVALFFAISSAKCGIFKALIFCLPELLVNIAAVVLLSKYGINLSIEILKCVFGAKHKTSFKLCIRKFSIFLIVSLILSSFSGVCEMLVRQIFT